MALSSVPQVALRVRRGHATWVRDVGTDVWIGLRSVDQETKSVSAVYSAAFRFGDRTSVASRCRREGSINGRALTVGRSFRSAAGGLHVEGHLAGPKGKTLVLRTDVLHGSGRRRSSSHQKCRHALTMSPGLSNWAAPTSTSQSARRSIRGRRDSASGTGGKLLESRRELDTQSSSVSTPGNGATQRRGLGYDVDGKDRGIAPRSGSRRRWRAL